MVVQVTAVCLRRILDMAQLKPKQKNTTHPAQTRLDAVASVSVQRFSGSLASPKTGGMWCMRNSKWSTSDVLSSKA